MRRRALVAAALACLALCSGCGLPQDAAPRNIDLSDQPVGLKPAAAPVAVGDPGPKVWFLKEDEGLKLYNESRDVEPHAEALLQALLGGPTAEEVQEGVLNQIPAGTTLLNVSLPDEVGTLAVDLSEEFLTQVGSPVGNALGQVVFTAMEDPRVQRVVVTVAGLSYVWVIDGSPVAEGAGMTAFDFKHLNATEYPPPGVFNPTEPTTTTTRPRNDDAN